jgi:hypothetical protein
MSLIHALAGSVGSSGGAAIKPLYTGLSEVTVSSATAQIDFNLTSGDFADYTTFYFRACVKGDISNAYYLANLIDDRNQQYAYTSWAHLGVSGASVQCSPAGNGYTINSPNGSMADSNDDADRWTWVDTWFAGRGDAAENFNEVCIQELVNSYEPNNQFYMGGSSGWNTVTPSKFSFRSKTGVNSEDFAVGTKIQAYGVTYGYTGE